jgi:uncharacterized protein YerC
MRWERDRQAGMEKRSSSSRLKLQRMTRSTQGSHGSNVHQEQGPATASLGRSSRATPSAITPPEESQVQFQKHCTRIGGQQRRRNPQGIKPAGQGRQYQAEQLRAQDGTSYASRAAVRKMLWHGRNPACMLLCQVAYRKHRRQAAAVRDLAKLTRSCAGSRHRH